MFMQLAAWSGVIKWKHSPRYWPFVRGIHRWPVVSSHKGPVTQNNPHVVTSSCHLTKRRLMVRSWWRHQMERFSALLALCAGNSPVPGEFPSQKSVTRSFDVLFDLRLNKRLSKQSWDCWFETPSRSLWRHCNDPMESRSRKIRVCT